MSDRRIQSNL